eukprot:jgi/Hompol1/6187/HPOL_004866-RA
MLVATASMVAGPGARTKSSATTAAATAPPTGGQLWRLDALAQSVLDSLFIRRLPADSQPGDSQIHATERETAAGLRTLKMLQGKLSISITNTNIIKSAFFWAGLKHAAVLPPPISQRLLLVLFAAYVLHADQMRLSPAAPVEPAGLEVLVAARDVLETSIDVPKHYIDIYLQLVVELRTQIFIVMMSDTSSDDFDQSDHEHVCYAQLARAFESPIVLLDPDAEQLFARMLEDRRLQLVDHVTLCATSTEMLHDYYPYSAFADDAQASIGFLASLLHRQYPAERVREIVRLQCLVIDSSAAVDIHDLTLLTVFTHVIVLYLIASDLASEANVTRQAVSRGVKRITRRDHEQRSAPTETLTSFGAQWIAENAESNGPEQSGQSYDMLFSSDADEAVSPNISHQSFEHSRKRPEPLNSDEVQEDQDEEDSYNRDMEDGEIDQDLNSDHDSGDEQHDEIES